MVPPILGCYVDIYFIYNSSVSIIIQKKSFIFALIIMYSFVSLPLPCSLNVTAFPTDQFSHIISSVCSKRPNCFSFSGLTWQYKVSGARTKVMLVSQSIQLDNYLEGKAKKWV